MLIGLEKDEQGDFLWPGFGHNSRVLKWIFERCDGVAPAKLTPIGNIPTEDSIDIRGLPMKHAALEKLLEIDHDAWIEEVKSIRSYYETIGDKLISLEMN